MTPPLLTDRAACPSARPSAWRSRIRRREGRSDRGQSSIEFIGFLPILLLLALAGVQLGLAAYTANQAGTAARAAARYVSQDDSNNAAQAGRNAISGWLADDATFAEDRPSGEVSVTATLQIPSVIPGVTFGSVERKTTMPRADD